VKKRLSRILFYILGGITLLTIIGFGIFYLKKDTIVERVISVLNKNQKGIITFENLAFSPFKNFPSISLRIDKVAFYERADDFYPFVEIGRLFVSMDVMKLINGEVNVSKISLEDGFINLQIDDTGSLNLVNAIEPDSVIISQSPTSRQEQSEIKIELQSIEISDVQFSIEDSRSKFKVNLNISDLHSFLEYANNEINIEADLDFILHSININNRTFLENKLFSLTTGFSYNESLGMIKVIDGKLKQESLDFLLDGIYDLNQNYIDLHIDVTDDAFELLSLVMEDDIIDINKNLVDHGELFFNGSIKGYTIDSIPNFSFQYGAKQVRIRLPDGRTVVQSFDFDGSIETGTNPDFSGATLNITKLEAIIFDKRISGTLYIKDFTNPDVQLQVKGKVDLNDFNSIVNIQNIANMKGLVDFNLFVDNDFKTAKQDIPLRKANLSLDLSNVSIEFSDSITIHELNGKIFKESTTIQLEDISFKIDSSDFEVNGQMKNAVGFIFSNSIFSADLVVESKKVHLNDFGIDENISIMDLKTDFELRISSFNSEETEINLDLKSFSGESANYPDVSKLTASFTYLENSNSAKLTISRLDAQTSLGSINTTSTITSDSSGINILTQELNVYTKSGDVAVTGSFHIDSSLIKLDAFVNTSNLWVESFIAEINNKPTLQDSLRASINSSFEIKSEISTGDVLTVSLSILNSNIVFTHPQTDTINITNLGLKVSSFRYQKADTFSLENIISFESTMTLDQLITRRLKERNVAFSISKDSDIVSVTLDSENLAVGNKENATLDIDLSGPEIVYALDYRLNNVSLDPYFIAEEDTIVKGLIDFKFTVNTTGNDIPAIISNSKGVVLIDGDNIEIKGFDLDEILANYKRSQNFQLTDVGAYMLVGPFGAVVTKGFDFARIAQINPEDSTIIRKLHSEWIIDNKILSTRDVAFATDKSRIAIDGSIDLSDNSIPGLMVAVVDARGCSLMDQTVSGTFAEPEFGKLNVVGTLFGAVVNVFKVAAGNQCKPIYTGLVQHPVKK